MTDYTKTPRFDVRTFRKVPEGFFGEAVGNVIQAAGPMDSQQAMKIVEAVFGPLLLLSPPPDHYMTCQHAYYRYEGGWVFCTKDHSHDDRDPHLHWTADGETDWYSDSGDERAFDPWR